MSLAYDFHPEFGYFCPGPRFRRELRIAVVSVLAGLVIGAVIVTLRAGHAVETGGISSKAHLTSSGPDTGAPSVAGPSLRLANVDKADPAEAIKPFPMRVRARSSKTASAIVGIPLGHIAPPEPDIVPASAGPASPENAQGLGSPAASPQAPSLAETAAPAVSGTKGRRSATHARHHRDDENKNARWQNRRVPYWAGRGYADDQYWRGPYRHAVYW